MLNLLLETTSVYCNATLSVDRNNHIITSSSQMGHEALICSSVSELPPLRSPVLQHSVHRYSTLSSLCWRRTRRTSNGCFGKPDNAFMASKGFTDSNTQHLTPAGSIIRLLWICECICSDAMLLDWTYVYSSIGTHYHTFVFLLKHY